MKMEMELDIEFQVKLVLSEEFDCNTEMIAPKSRLRQDLGLDQFEIADFAEALEERLQIPIDLAEFCPLESVGEIVAYLEKAHA
jgi:acyl carrier protein